MASNKNRVVEIGSTVKVGIGQKLLIIAGPCQIESTEHCLKIASELQKMCAKLPLQLVFKSSFDKANRTSANSKRGPGLDEGLKTLEQVKRETGLPILTDIHDAEQARIAAEVVDIIQTPAFLCRQTDLLIAAGKTGKAVNIKKGQFLHPGDMAHAAAKVASNGNHNILLCERGSCFGYRDLVVDMRGLLIMAQSGYPVVFDATHSVQQMGAGGDGQSSGGHVSGGHVSGGHREFIVPLVRAAVAAGVSGLFIECHENPDRAPSDAASMLPLALMPEVLAVACRIREAVC